MYDWHCSAATGFVPFHIGHVLHLQGRENDATDDTKPGIGTGAEGVFTVSSSHKCSSGAVTHEAGTIDEISCNVIFISAFEIIVHLSEHHH